jgi:hypothetical protein
MNERESGTRERERERERGGGCIYLGGYIDY